LHHAALSGQLEVVKWLIEKNVNANVDATDNHGRTVLHCAAESGQWDIVKQLKTDCGTSSRN
jgi:ankyrin repeat protein